MVTGNRGWKRVTSTTNKRHRQEVKLKGSVNRMRDKHAGTAESLGA